MVVVGCANRSSLDDVVVGKKSGVGTFRASRSLFG